MADDFAHVVTTRFNLATPGRESAFRNRPGWLAERFGHGGSNSPNNGSIQ